MSGTRLQRLPTVNGTELHILAKKDWGSNLHSRVANVLDFRRHYGNEVAHPPGTINVAGVFKSMVNLLVVGRSVGYLLVAMNYVWEGGCHNKGRCPGN